MEVAAQWHTKTTGSQPSINVEEWDAKGQTYETLAICRSLELARAGIRAAVI